MSGMTETLRRLEIGESHSVMKRTALKNHDPKAMQDELTAMNRVIGTLASRVKGLTVERVIGLNAAGTHILYGLVVTREKAA